jgi:hypothetical protein
MRRCDVFIFLLVFSSLYGCATTSGYEAVLQSWIGDSTDHLVSVWGPPQEQYALNGGGKLLQYTRSGQVVLPGVTTYQPVTTVSNGNATAFGTAGMATATYNGTSTSYVPQTSEPTVIHQECVTRFTADSTGRIVRWAWQGNACRAVAPKRPPVEQTAVQTQVAAPLYTKCTADQLRNGTCS